VPPRGGGVQSIDRAVLLLRCFTTQHPELSLSALAELSGLSVSTTFRLLGSLQDNGLVRQGPGRAYRLGPLVLRLASTLHATTSRRETALPIMTELRDATDETVGLHVLMPDLTRTVVDQVQSHQPLRRTYTEIGQSIPLHQGAPGKLLLSYLPEHEQDEVLARPLAKATEKTTVDPDQIRAELAIIREQGVAMSYAERVQGIRSVAAPIMDDTARIGSCLSVSGPEVRMTDARMLEIAEQVKDAAAEIGRLLGAAHGVIDT
jgi:IclR family acetate operon transcriptional repressor